jgi:hypothetical protein
MPHWTDNHRNRSVSGFLSLSWAVTSVKVIIGLKYAKKYFLYRRERSGGIKAFFRHAIEYKKRRTFQRIAP